MSGSRVVVVFTEERSLGNPDPEIYAFACDRLGVAPESAVGGPLALVRNGEVVLIKMVDSDVDKIVNAPRGANDKPTTPIKMLKVTVE